MFEISRTPAPTGGCASAPRPGRLFWLALIIALTVWGFVDVRRRGRVDVENPQGHMTDLTVYTEAGAAFFDGRDPYTVTNPRGWGYLYLPLFALIVSPLHYLRPQDQVLVWYVVSLLATWGCYRQCVRITGAIVRQDTARRKLPQGAPAWIAMIAVATVVLPALNCLQRGQVGLVQLFLLLVGFRLTMESRTRWQSFLAGVVLALPVVLKLTPLLPVACLLAQQFVAAWRGSSRSGAWGRAANGGLGIAAGMVLFVLVIPGLLVGMQANARHLQSWWRLVATKSVDPGYDTFAGDSHSVRNQSLQNAVWRFGNWADYEFAAGPDDREARTLDSSTSLFMDAPLVGKIVLDVRLLLLLVLGIAGWVMVRPDDLLGQAVTFGLACAATLLVAPVARGHYFVLLLPAVLWLPLWLVREGRPKAAWCLALAPATLTLTHYLLLDYSGRLGVLGIGAAVWYLAAIVVVCIARRSTVLRKSPASDSSVTAAAAVGSS